MIQPGINSSPSVIVIKTHILNLGHMVRFSNNLQQASLYSKVLNAKSLKRKVPVDVCFCVAIASLSFVFTSYNFLLILLSVSFSILYCIDV
jgi:hypothetical protein